jgi:phosphatidylserine/phosphatidylglycerophosphate/cardiolipin synthase-like enzyme
MARGLRGARRKVDIATPFLSKPVAGLLVRESHNARQRRILTAVNGPAVAGGYLDPLGVEIFIEAGFETRSLRNLHAKVVLADTSWGLVGSGNLTVAGSNGANAELGVVLTSAQIRRARGHFEEWWSAAEPVDLSYLRRLARTRRPKAPERQQRARARPPGGTAR